MGIFCVFYRVIRLGVLWDKNRLKNSSKIKVTDWAMSHYMTIELVAQVIVTKVKATNFRSKNKANNDSLVVTTSHGVSHSGKASKQVLKIVKLKPSSSGR